MNETSQRKPADVSSDRWRRGESGFGTRGTGKLAEVHVPGERLGKAEEENGLQVVARELPECRLQQREETRAQTERKKRGCCRKLRPKGHPGAPFSCGNSEKVQGLPECDGLPEGRFWSLLAVTLLP